MTLLEDLSVPVATPGYLATAAARAAPTDLRRHRLLLATEDDWDWQAWAAAAGRGCRQPAAAIAC